MKRLILVATLGVIGFVLAPVASASAAELTGECQVSGLATFPSGLSGVPKTADPYGFTGNATCKDTSGATHTGTVSITGGTGTLSCGASASEAEGQGTLNEESPGKEKYSFTLSFAGTGPVVALVVKVGGKPSATGAATFAKAENAKECPTGVNSLAFESLTVGTL
jgi:hypothetical protein